MGKLIGPEVGANPVAGKIASGIGLVAQGVQVSLRTQVIL
jgi:hypothetical protein